MRFQKSFAALAALCLLASPALAAKKYAPGVTDSEILVGQTEPYSGPLSGFSTNGNRRGRLLQDDQRQGRHQRPQNQDHQPRRRLHPPKTVEQTRKMVEQDHVALHLGSLGTAGETRCRNTSPTITSRSSWRRSASPGWSIRRNFPTRCPACRFSRSRRIAMPATFSNISPMRRSPCSPATTISATTCCKG